MDFCREGDTLVVTKLDRLARSVVHLGTILDQLTAKGTAVPGPRGHRAGLRRRGGGSAS